MAEQHESQCPDSSPSGSAAAVWFPGRAGLFNSPLPVPRSRSMKQSTELPGGGVCKLARHSWDGLKALQGPKARLASHKRAGEQAGPRALSTQRGAALPLPLRDTYRHVPPCEATPHSTWRGCPGAGAEEHLWQGDCILGCERRCASCGESAPSAWKSGNISACLSWETPSVCSQADWVFTSSLKDLRNLINDTLDDFKKIFY